MGNPITHKYGWKRGLPVFGGKQFEIPPATAAPMRADLGPGMPPVYDQGNLGSCTANAGGGLAQFLTKKLGWKNYLPARLAMYYWTRLAESNVMDDTGASLSATATMMKNRGVPNEVNWPYIISRFQVKPTANVEANGRQHLVLDPMQVRQKMDDIRSCISLGYPIMFGFTVYESFETDAVRLGGIMPMPRQGELILGGHAVLAFAYDDYTRMVKCRNSWGYRWGLNGSFWMPYDYISNPWFADDFWTATKITGWKPPA